MDKEPPKKPGMSKKRARGLARIFYALGQLEDGDMEPLQKIIREDEEQRQIEENMDAIRKLLRKMLK